MSASDNQLVATRADLGDQWPFTADQAVIRCDDGIALIANIDGADYALNGVAISRGFEELDGDSTVWLNNPSTGAKVSLYPLTSWVRPQLCSD